MNEEVNFCSQCGATVNLDAKFCSNCGHDLQNSDQTPLYIPDLGFSFHKLQ